MQRINHYTDIFPPTPHSEIHQTLKGVYTVHVYSLCTLHTCMYLWYIVYIYDRVIQVLIKGSSRTIEHLCTLAKRVMADELVLYKSSQLNDYSQFNCFGCFFNFYKVREKKKDLHAMAEDCVVVRNSAGQNGRPHSHSARVPSTHIVHH